MLKRTQHAHAPLTMAELHYFAIPRDNWELLLVRARQLGAQAITARVPWAWHMLSSGAFDLVGASDPRRDIVGFARLCGQLGLPVVLHPGPLHGAVLLGGGVPAALLQQHPEACALDADSQPWLDDGGLPSACMLHPVYLAAAHDWIEAFSTAMLALQSPHGPLAALRVGGASMHGRIDYNLAARARPDAPDLGSGDFERWYAVTADANVSEWLRAAGWTLPLEEAPRPAVAQQDALHGAGFVAALFDRGTRSATLVDPPDGYPHPLIAGTTHPVVGAPIDADGRVRPRFWRSKMASTFINSAAADFATARAPADLALGYAGAYEPADSASGTLQAFAQRLAHDAIAFDILDLETATREALARYALVIVPALPALPHAIVQKLQSSSNIMLIDLEGVSLTDSPADSLTRSPTLPADVSTERLTELIEERGGNARYAWADGDAIDLSIRYGATYIYLLINNRRQSSYNGILAYRSTDGEVLHLHTGIGAGRAGMVLLVGDEVHGVAIDGDGSEGGWLARGLRSSVVFNTGAGALVRCGDGLIFTAPQSGRLQTRRTEGWDGMAAHRLLLSGALLPARLQIDSTHLSVLYVAEDEQGQTDVYLVLRPGALPLALRDYLATLLAARAATLRRAAALAEQLPTAADHVYARAAEAFAAAATGLESTAAQLASLEIYSTAWLAADECGAPAIIALKRALTIIRGAALSGALDQAVYTAQEQQIAQILHLATRLDG